MWMMAAALGKEYWKQIVGGIALLLVLGYSVYAAQNWCNHACRVAKVELAEAKEALDVCKAKAAKDEAFYREQQASWEKQVANQKKAIGTAKKKKAEIVEKGRKSFDNIFKENSKNEQESKARIAVAVRPADVVTAPLALVREYNEAVAASASIAEGGSGGPVGAAGNPIDLAGEVGTFDAMAVAEAVVENVHKYNQLALRCNTLIDIVKELEEKHGIHNGGTDGKAEQSGGDVLSGAATAQIF
jgi:hypothetical protein